MAPSGLNLFSISPDQPFADTLAEGLMAETHGDPVRLAQYLILLPNRRAARALREAFLRHSKGQPMLLPRMRAVDQVDEDEIAFFEEGPLDLTPAISGLERRMMLARMIQSAHFTGTPDQALLLAEELARFLDSAQIEEIDMARLADLDLAADLAEHWQKTLTFLEIVTQHWPTILTAQGRLDPQDRINRLLRHQTELWRTNPPATPIVAAGSTGTRPATADMLKVVAQLPLGRVVLPGLDWGLDDDAWKAIDDQHPQFGLKRLLAHLGAARTQVKPFVAHTPSPRVRLGSEIMRPAKATEAWRTLSGQLLPDALQGLARLDLSSPRQEAGIIALILRDTLEVPGRTAALVTPDRALAARVRAELSRWNIDIDDSAGTEISKTLPGTLLALLAETVAQDFAPHSVLALLKHPLCHGGMERAKFRALVAHLEADALRGPRPGPGLAGLKAAVATQETLSDFIDTLDMTVGPFHALFSHASVALDRLVVAHLECAERLAADPTTPGPLRLWAGEAGEMLAAQASELIKAAALMGEIDPAHYPSILQTVLAGLVVRPRWGRHPRLSLWGPIEARLQRADVMILAGLNEGVWPPDAPADPWMSRPMRAKIGLPLPERRIGLAAHDFVQALCAPTVYLTRSTRVDGAPTTPARWLLRLDTVMKAAQLDWPDKGEAWIDWYRQLDRPSQADPPRIPAPRPALHARPRDLPVTAVETWMRDPYGVYAKYVLKLRALKPIDQDPAAADYGQLVHTALERFTTHYPGPLAPNALNTLLGIGDQVFDATASRPGVRAFWLPRFHAVAQWFLTQESERRAHITQSFCEIRGELILKDGFEPFRLTAIADRIDQMTDGSVTIIDYKTGSPPSKREVAAGFAPQLPLEAAIAQAGGFNSIGAATVSQLMFWQLKGGAEGGKSISATDDPMATAAEALDGLKGLIRAFDDPATPYEARPHPDHAPRYSDYEHLARVAEWSSGGDSGSPESGDDS